MTANTDKTRALSIRNQKWHNLDSIPSWVDVDDVGLDQFFTKPDIAKKCLESFQRFLRNRGVETRDYTYLEPAAGAGAFYNLLPENKIGLDICPMQAGIQEEDFLSWQPNATKFLAVGNPPFGYRGWLALTFMNKVAQIADYVGFILPMSFQSDGKGSPKRRVKGMRLVHSEVLEPNSFMSPDGKTVKINALWQIWEKGENTAELQETCNNWVDLFTVDMRKERLCGQEKIEHADFFLQRTFYSEPPQLVKSFDQVKYVCGYGLIIKRDKSNVVKTLSQVDWRKYSNLAAHNCRHISMYHIQKVLTEKGFVDV